MELMLATALVVTSLGWPALLVLLHKRNHDHELKVTERMAIVWEQGFFVGRDTDRERVSLANQFEGLKDAEKQTLHPPIEADRYVTPPDQRQQLHPDEITMGART